MNETLVYGLATLGVGFLALLVKFSFKSKCIDINICCGLISIKRDVEAEIKADNKDLENGIKEPTL